VAVAIPMWIFSIPRKVLRAIERLARDENTSEAEIVERAVQLVKDQIAKKNMQMGGIKEDTIYIRSLAVRIPVSRAREIVQEISRYFGRIAQASLSPEQRTAKARKAANTRWKKEKQKGGKREKPGKK
jgi:hypothetical protein